MIVPGGGLSLDGARWVAARANFLVHGNVLARLFRGKMLAMLMDAHRAGQLKFFNTQAGLADKRKLLAVATPHTEPEAASTQQSDQPRVHPRPCPCCGGRMIVIE